ncbi:hypothetical protein K1Y77_17050 (plasmid) [Halomonas qaidamensis]|uniref:Chemotaxis protein n=1 Tax=Halomonas qaidamensis TaxID=2866211 RepID=A0ABY6JYT8_9GAMM|nr:hypothetical protein [Halomonas qaidamensis]UYV20927.1 hypothetical protein K1Y77_17050 [Halomonas qaidamensis]
MISRLLGGLKPWLLVAVLAAALAVVAYVLVLRSQLDSVQHQHAKSQAALDITTATLAVQVEQNRLLVEALDVRERELNDGAQRIDRLRAQAEALGADDANDVSKAWANQRLPSDVSSWVRDLITPGDAGAKSSGAAVVSD